MNRMYNSRSRYVKARSSHGNLILLGFVLFCYYSYYHGVSPSVTIETVLLVLFISIIFYCLFIPSAYIYRIAKDLYMRHRKRKVMYFAKDINSLRWDEFEQYVADKLKQQGYTNVRLTEQYDLGIDVIAEKDGVVWGVLVKHSKYPVRIEAVREAVAGLKVYGCDRAMVVTNSSFTKPAEKLAKSNGCVLIDRKLIAKWRKG